MRFIAKIQLDYYYSSIALTATDIIVEQVAEDSNLFLIFNWNFFAVFTYNILQQS